MKLLLLIALFVVCVTVEGISKFSFQEYDTSDWLLTPIGLAHPSCIHRVKNGAEVRRTQTSVGNLQVLNEDGSFRNIPRCRYPVIFPTKQTKIHFFTYCQKNGTNTGASFAPGWQVWTTYQSSTTQGFTAFLGYFTIPNAPASSWGDQTLFMFTGLQNENWVPGPNAPPAPQDFEIIQPVLQWGGSAGGGGNYWTLASWYVTVYDGFLISDLISVNAGDVIFGNMTLVGADDWFISGVTQQSKQTTSLKAKKSNLKVNPWAYCTLEVYGANGDCDEYPSNNQVYTKLQLWDAGKAVTPKWQINVTPSPICGEHVTVESPSQVTIHFGQT
jgi:hypothetical protein